MQHAESTHDVLLQRFSEYFEIVHADAPPLLDEVFKVRYEAFESCLLLDRSQCPDGLEKDAYDDGAIHSLLYHRRSGNCAGTVRVVLPPEHDNGWMFPIDKATRSKLGRSVLPQSLPKGSIGEISRFCLSSRFRIRAGEQRWPDGVPDAQDEVEETDERRTFPHPILGLITAAVQMSWECKLSYWYALMEPRLERRLKRFGLIFEPLSESFEYYGTRRAYLAHLPDLIGNVQNTHPEVWALLTNHGQYSFPAHDRKAPASDRDAAPNR